MLVASMRMTIRERRGFNVLHRPCAQGRPKMRPFGQGKRHRRIFQTGLPAFTCIAGKPVMKSGCTAFSKCSGIFNGIFNTVQWHL